MITLPLLPFLQLSEGTDLQEEKMCLYRALGQTDKKNILKMCHKYSLSVSGMVTLVETKGDREGLGGGGGMRGVRGEGRVERDEGRVERDEGRGG